MKKYSRQRAEELASKKYPFKQFEYKSNERRAFSQEGFIEGYLTKEEEVKDLVEHVIRLVELYKREDGKVSPAMAALFAHAKQLLK